VNTRASAAQGRPLTVFLVSAVTTLLMDQVSKALAAAVLRPEVSVPLFGSPVRLTLLHNTGMAFGVAMPSAGLLAVGVLVSLAIVWYAARESGLSQHPRYALALGMVLGGSLGNLTDRIRTRGVTDFIDLRFWPVFNLADVAIAAGFALLAVQALRAR